MQPDDDGAPGRGGADRGPGNTGRSDARRNRDRILEAATELFLRDGPDTSLEAVARRAGVGSATLHRHFRGRRALLAAVYDDHLDALAGRAPVVAAESDPATALPCWLTEVARHCLANLPLLQLMRDEGGEAGSWRVLLDAGEPLRRAAVQAGTLAPEHRLEDLLVLVNAVVEVSAAEPARIDHLLGIVYAGAAPTVGGVALIRPEHPSS